MTSSQPVLSVADQSPVRQGEPPSSALRDTIRLAQAAERLGYARYWVAEHHNTGSFAGTSPEILIGQIAAHTSRIRVGSGGVMLSHYSAFKVAEQFSVLNSLFPGRIDLGIGRAPGSDQLTAAALSYPRRQMDSGHFPQQVADMLGYLHGTMSAEHPFARLQIQPGRREDSAPEVWLLGSSDYSARLAAALGLPFAFADFFGTGREIGPFVCDLYRREFRPHGFIDEPRVNVTLHILCAPTEEEAHRLATSRNLNRAAHVLGLRGLLPPDEAAAKIKSLPEDVQHYIKGRSQGSIDGDPAQVKERILATAERYGTNDVGLVTICYAFEDRVRSYDLVAQAFGLQPSA
jgi:luciferase family oxidoreductase group 1